MTKSFLRLYSRVILILAICGIFSHTYSQDAHFSQFNETPLLLNPASAGVFNGDIRAILNYRNQWKSISNPYTTGLFSFDMGLMKKKWNGAYLGAGFLVYSDKAGKSEFGTTQANLSLSAVIKISEKHSLSAGINGGMAQKGIKNTNLKWGNQFDGDVYDPAIASGEAGNLNNEPFVYEDFGAGMNWNFISRPVNMASNDKIMANVGIAMFHLNKPKQQFYVDEFESLYSKLVIHGTSYFGIKSTTIAVLPGLQFATQKNTTEIIVGSMIRYGLKEESKYTGFIKESAVLIGGHIRLGDAFIPSVMLEIANFAVGISYDLNISPLKTATGGKGGFEISLRFINPSPFKNNRGGAMF